MEDILFSKKKFNVDESEQKDQSERPKYNYTSEILLNNLNNDKKRGLLLEEALMRGNAD